MSSLNTICAQNKKGYYIELKPNVSLGTIQKTVNSDQTLSITTAINDFSALVNSRNVYTFKQAFPGITSERLQRVYYIEFSENEIVQEFDQRTEIENFIELEVPDLLFDLPNDYTEVSTAPGSSEYLCNTALESISAPLAWTVTTGSPDIYVGIVDSKFDLHHPDLQNKVVVNLDDALDNVPFHGTQVANFAGGDTNNGIGVSSIGYNTKLVTADDYTKQATRVWEVANIPGVKVINCSWAYPSYVSIQDEVYQYINDELGVLVVAAAGNSNSSAYKYPASYPSVLSVAAVGNRYDVGEINNHNPIHFSWKDVHYYRDNEEGIKSFSHNDKVDVSAPGQWIQQAGDNYDSNETVDGYFLGSGSSGSSPIVAGLAALIFSIDPNFTPNQVRDIIRDTADDIYHIPQNQLYLGKLGTGRINAFAAVKRAFCMRYTSITNYDLAMQNSKVHGFEEPDLDTEYVWHSKDIWVRNQQDGTIVKTHQNPEYSASQPNYAYVRVTNNGCRTTNGTDTMRLYWAKANTELTWPLHWTGNLTIPDPITNEDVLMGDEIGDLTIPILESGESIILEFPWNVPNPENFENINQNPWHFCLLARVESENDPMSYPEITAITENVTNNNNIAWKNTTIIDVIPGFAGKTSGVVALGNSSSNSKTSYLEFVTDTIANVTPLYEAAEITIAMDTAVFDAWTAGGSSENNFAQTKVAEHKIVASNVATLSDIVFPANTYATLNISFNFLTDKKDNKAYYTFHVIQKDAITNEIIGGETYIINKHPRPTFQAEAGADKEIERDEAVTISAAQINEAAIYNWYDPDGTLVYTGKDLTVTPNVTKTYTLEIISDSDGYKDYDEVEVKVNPYKIESLVPNPSSNQVTINYEADEAGSAYLIVVGTQNDTSNNYILDTQSTLITLDVTSFENGIYAVALVCDGVIVGSKNLYKN